MTEMGGHDRRALTVERPVHARAAARNSALQRGGSTAVSAATSGDN
jgi:hypothetical protein